MKKQLFLGVLMMLLTITGVFAATNAQPFFVKSRKETQDQIMTREQMRMFVEEALQNLEGATFEHRIKSNLSGLHNALIHVNNTLAVEQLQLNLERWQNRYQYQYGQLDVTEVDGETFVRARKNFRFLIFNFRVEDEYKINDEGEVVMEQRHWLSRFLIREGEAGDPVENA